MTNDTYQSGLNQIAKIMANSVWMAGSLALLFELIPFAGQSSFGAYLPHLSVITSALLIFSGASLRYIQQHPGTRPPLPLLLILPVIAVTFILLLDYQPVINLTPVVSDHGIHNGSPQILFSLLLSLLALACLHCKQVVIAHWLTSANLSLLLVVLFSYAHHDDGIYHYGDHSGSALLTTSLCFLLNWAIVFTHPQDSFMRMLISPFVDGMISRLTISLTVFIPLFLAWITPLIPVNTTLSLHDFSIVLSPLLLLMAIALILLLAKNLSEAERMRQKAEQEALDHQAQLAHMARVHAMHELTTGIAHELNQPLAAIKNYSAAGHNFLAQGIDSRVQMSTLFTHIREQADRAADIIRQLRSFIQKNPQQKKPADLNTLIRNVSRLMTTELSRHQVKIQFGLASRLPLLDMDTIQIEQVILNLMQNAIDAMADTPEEQRLLIISSRRIAFDRVQFDITDHGCGINADLQHAIFVPFVSTKQESGLGIGLSLCRSLIESHQGALWLESSTPTGSTFSFQLPTRTDD